MPTPWLKVILQHESTSYLHQVLDFIRERSADYEVTFSNSVLLEMTAKGDSTPYEDVLRDLRARDDQDMNREVDPLRPTEDAVIVDSTDMNFDQVVEYILKIVEEKTHE